MSDFQSIVDRVEIEPLRGEFTEFTQLASEKQIEKTVQALQAHGIRVVVVDTGEEARKYVLDLIPDGAEVYNSTSRTLELIGLAEQIEDPAHVKTVLIVEGDPDIGEALTIFLRETTAYQVIHVFDGFAALKVVRTLIPRQSCRANPTRRVSGKPGAIQIP